jgi:hypothetical protein
MRAPHITAFWLLAGLSILFAPILQAQAPLTQVTGRVVCLKPSLDPDSPEGECALYGLRTEERTYSFLAKDPRTEIFSDPRVRERTLRVTGRTKEGDQIEITAVQSIRDGRPHDLYYRCEVCNITAYAGGPCACCQAELEFRETPAADQ